MSASDYTGRRFDVLALRGGQSSGVQQLESSLFAPAVSGEVCTGIQKLAQRWVLEFLTIRGSMGFHLEDRGSDFVQWLRQGRLRTEFDVQTYFGFAARQVQNSLREEEPEDMPDDERLDQATLAQVQISEQGLELTVEVTSRAGESRQVILPLALTPANMAL